MSLSQGRQYLAIPGPSVIPDRVLQAMNQPCPNIYDGDLIELTHSLAPDLKHVAQTKGNVAIYIANGHGAWEAAVSNVLAPDDTVLVLATGRFCIGWGEMAQNLGVNVETLDFGTHDTINLEVVRDHLRADKNGRIKAVMAVHVDTSTSIRNDISELRSVISDTGHGALLMVDCIASLGCDEFLMDDWGVDIMVSACQKGLMTPPALSFVYFSDHAASARNKMERVSSYWDWNPRTNPNLFYEYFCGTAPTQHLLGLREALDMINEEGLPHIWERHKVLAKAVWASCETWAQSGPLKLNVSDENLRSKAVTALSIGAPNGMQLRKWTENEAGLTLGIGLGMNTLEDPKAEGSFRIGHMGHVNAQMIMGALGSVQAGLIALDIPHGVGGLDAAAQVLANSGKPY
jgi:alanine-glyoxylate transaminase/serine-glyoxylate transaminase/serine-pyruvate transaminase|tara:strand:+ start:4127 stop:5335 length:1209 start_codon:yes stop_codon:yes gene_type:complete